MHRRKTSIITPPDTAWINQQGSSRVRQSGGVQIVDTLSGTAEVEETESGIGGQLGATEDSASYRPAKDETSDRDANGDNVNRNNGNGNNIDGDNITHIQLIPQPLQPPVLNGVKDGKQTNNINGNDNINGDNDNSGNTNHGFHDNNNEE